MCGNGKVYKHVKHDAGVKIQWSQGLFFFFQTKNKNIVSSAHQISDRCGGKAD